MLKISKKQYLTFIEKKCLQISLYMEKVVLLKEHILNIFKYYISNKETNCDYRQYPLMADKTKKKISWEKDLTWQNIFTVMVKEKVIVIKYWKNLQNMIEILLDENFVWDVKKYKYSVIFFLHNKHQNKFFLLKRTCY